MNKTYTLIWSDARQTWVVAHEAARTRGKPSSRRAGLAGSVLVGLVALLGQNAGAQAPPASALPTGGQVVAGQASLSQSGATLNIQQSSNRAILNWQRFDIGSQATVNFLQPSAQAIALNRVLGSDASAVYGTLKANGQVFLVNPNGVLFGAGARVDVGGLVASSLNLRDDDFLAGRYRFTRDGAHGQVLNQGALGARYVGLLAPEVRNEGVIVAPQGTVALAAGEAITLNISGNALVDVQVERASIDTLVENRHLVQADAGLVVLSAQSAAGLLGQVVNSGTVAAQGLSADGGTVRLLASSHLQHSGRVSVDAGTQGRGGSATLLADLANPGSQTAVSGSLSARGGQAGGDGGFIETSASQLQIAGQARVDTSAPQGRTGTWLLDPQDFTIAARNGNITGAALSLALASNNITIQTTDTSASCSTGASCTGGSVGNGDIFVNDSVSWSSDRTLTLNAWRDIRVNAPISVTGAGGLAFKFGQAGTPDDMLPAAGGYRLTAPVNLSPNASFSTTYLRDGPTTPTTTTQYSIVVASADKVAGKSVGLEDVGLTGNYVLGANLNTSTTPALANWTPIGTDANAFDGSFDGLGHTITGLTVSGAGANNSHVGLFGVLRPTTNFMTFESTPGLVQNVGLIDANVSGLSQVGALVGRNDGRIANSYATASGSGTSVVTGRDLAGVGPNAGSNDDTVTAIGGLVGYNTGAIVASHAKVTVNATSGDQTSLGHGQAGGIGGLVGVHVSGSIGGSYAAGAVNGLADVGGFAGYTASSMSANYARGEVNAGVASAGVGGFVGHFDNPGNLPGLLSANFWDTTTSRQATSGGQLADEVTGMTTAQMQTAANFKLPTAANGASLAPGWESTTSWELRDGGYPLLADQLKTVFVIADNKSTVYNGLAASGFTATVTGADASAYSGTPTATASGGATNVGNYSLTPNAITLNAVDDQGGYRVEYVAGSLTITPRTVTLTAGSNAAGSRSYGDASNPAVGVTVGGLGAANGDNLQALLGYSVASAASATTAAGTYAAGANAYKVSGTTVGVHGNYEVTALNDGTLTIDPRKVSLTAGSNAAGTRTAGDATNPAVGFSVGGQGAANGDNLQALLGLSVGSAANAATPAGTYASGPNAYKVSGTTVGVHGNYQVTALNDGTLTIDPAPAPAPAPAPSPAPAPAPATPTTSPSLAGTVAIIQRPQSNPGTSGSGTAPQTGTTAIAPDSRNSTVAMLGQPRTSTPTATTTGTAGTTASGPKPMSRATQIAALVTAGKTLVDAWSISLKNGANPGQLTAEEKDKIDPDRIAGAQAVIDKLDATVKGPLLELLMTQTALAEAEGKARTAAAAAQQAQDMANTAQAKAKASTDAATQAAQDAATPPPSEAKTLAALKAQLQASKDGQAARTALLQAGDAQTEADKTASTVATLGDGQRVAEAKLTAALSEQDKQTTAQAATDTGVAASKKTDTLNLANAINSITTTNLAATQKRVLDAGGITQTVNDQVSSTNQKSLQSQRDAEQATAATATAERNARQANADAPQKAGVIAQLEHLRGLIVTLTQWQTGARVTGPHVAAAQEAERLVKAALANKDSADLATLQRQLKEVMASAANAASTREENVVYNQGQYRVGRDADRQYLLVAGYLQIGMESTKMNMVAAEATKKATEAAATLAAARATEAQKKAQAAQDQAAAAQAAANAAKQDKTTKQDVEKYIFLVNFAQQAAAAAAEAKAEADEANRAKAAADDAAKKAAADWQLANLAVKREEAAAAANAKANAERELAAARSQVTQREALLKEANQDVARAKADATKATELVASARADVASNAAETQRWQKLAEEKTAAIPAAAATAKADLDAFNAAVARLETARAVANLALSEANKATEAANELGKAVGKARGNTFMAAIGAAGGQSNIQLAENLIKGKGFFAPLDEYKEAVGEQKDAEATYKDAYDAAQAKRAAFTAAQAAENEALKAVLAAQDKANASARAEALTKAEKAQAEQNVAITTNNASIYEARVAAAQSYAQEANGQIAAAESNAAYVAGALDGAKKAVAEATTNAAAKTALAAQADAAVKAAQAS